MCQSLGTLSLNCIILFVIFLLICMTVLTWQCLLLCGIKNENKPLPNLCVLVVFLKSLIRVSYFGYHKATIEFDSKSIFTIEIFVILFL